ncbi:cell envelope integrity protein CreD [Sphingobacterium paramultivorum]|uniref:Cell envelope integrity protein CreD n=1 Tax=Sphingobacterium paramultivorum TaxID=2886510 RepID=A0A7G5E4T4_9SPHI|nr:MULTISPECIES: cell envelope integrity protein CreD [Sphingobacterium]MCS4165531.1 inner membrane protein [Sphingobacterium sp. BIGb0116]QMV69009.1 cell envelope integrity protein CreD [Sphingobacterium paramultivorum]WSO12786.1 cell envelope integrity protein CreD [Sphingobacterium paramultivorum]
MNYNNLPPTEQSSFFEKISNSTVLKLFVIFFLSLILLIPLALISDLIEERKNREQEVSDGITLNWGKDQVISSPVLAIPYRETIPLSTEKAEKSNLREELKWIFVLPKTSNIATDVTPQHLSRGIYNAVVYNSNITLEGSFDKISLEKLEIPHEQIDWKGSKLIFGIQDFKGLGKRPSLNWDGNELTFDPDFNNLKLFTQNLVCPVSLDPQKTDNRFKIKLNLKGSKSLNFLPLGDQTNIQAKGNWANPSFTGAFLPSKRNTETSNFSASWEIPSFSRKLPQQWTGDARSIYQFDNNLENGNEGNEHKAAQTATTTLASANNLLDNTDMITINFLPDINNYQKTTRVAKYGILVILLTFTSLLFTEVIKKKRIHIIQYILIGAAMVLFYTLLLALSEHIGFNLAYLTASVATVMLIGSFIKSITKDQKSALLLSSILALFYLFIYILMQLRDYSLVAGTIGIFIILAILMRVSTKINWYQFDNSHVDQ